MPGLAELTLNHTQHHSSLLEHLNTFRQQDQLLCDCTLVVEGHSFPVHKVVLAASSDYFRALFTADFKESSLTDITLNGASVYTFKLVLDFLYSGKITLSRANVTDVFITADMLRLEGLQDMCQDYLLSQLCSSNCIGMWRFGRSFHSKILEEFSLHYMVTHLTEVMEGQEYLELESCGALSSRDLDPIETSTFVGKQEQIHRLLSVSHVGHLPEPSYTITWHHHDIPPSSRSLVAVGGYSNGLTERMCEVYDGDSSSWQSAGWSLPHSCKHIHWVGVIGVKLYVIAGNSLANINLILTRLTDEAAVRLQTDTLSRGWEEEIILPHDVSNMKFCVLHECIYGCGLITDTTSGICRYSPSTGQWELVTNIASNPKVFLEFFSQGSKLYLLGGLCVSSGMPTSQFESYDPNTDSWEYLHEMNVSRYNFGAGIWGECLYAVGGIGSDDTMLDSVEQYDFQTGRWSFAPSLPSPRASMGCEVWGGRLFAVGGEIKGTGSTQCNDSLILHPFEKWIATAPLSRPRSFSHFIVL